jgi:PBP1b-binding outer membrane lipoprotein LpoB
MKTRIVIALLIIIVFFESCARSFTPYEAANHPRGKKCGVIK